mmetsp:Transcript_38007/g.120798  ORF Transcript_38007/g.120798 Transcript_38007/m.120798 type:complete len:496 (-) Transcript_38007:381-1868(-)
MRAFQSLKAATQRRGLVSQEDVPGTEADSVASDAAQADAAAAEDAAAARPAEQGRRRRSRGPPSRRAAAAAGTVAEAAAAKAAAAALAALAAARAERKLHRKFLRSFVVECAEVSLVTFACMPVAFCLARFTTLLAVYVQIGLCILCGAVWQHRLMRRLQAHVMGVEFQQSLHLRRAIDELHTSQWFLPKVETWILWLIISLPDFVDPAMDAASAGQSGAALTPAMAARFASPWQAVPLLGALVAWLGLPGILTVLLVLAALFQVLALRRYRSLLLDLLPESGPDQTERRITTGTDDFCGPIWHDANDSDDSDDAADAADVDYSRFLAWLFLTHQADAGNLTWVASVVHHLAEAEIARHAESGSASLRFYMADRSAKFSAKIFVEAAPATWFQISLLSLTLDPDSFSFTLSTMTVLVSISTSLVMSAAGIPDFVRATRELAASGNYTCQRLVLVRCVPLCIVIVLLVANLARLAGIWVCPSHVLNLTSGCWEAQG